MKPAHFATTVVVLAGVGVSLTLGPGARGLQADQFADPRMARAALETTPLRVCGEDQVLPQPIAPLWTNVVLAGDSRMFAPCVGGQHGENHRELRESQLLLAVASANDPVLRMFSAQAFGKLGPGAVGTLPQADAPITTLRNGPLVALLKDPAPLVRREAARAYVRALDGVVGERLLDPEDVRPFPAIVDWARLYLTQHLATETNDEVAATIMETLAVLRHADDRTRDEVESVLAGLATGSSTRVLGAAKGLEALIRLNPKRKVSEAAITRLRQLAIAGPRTSPVPTRSGEGSAPAPGDHDNYARVRRLAMMALQIARDEDIPTLMSASQDADWQVRRLAALRMDLARPEFAPAVVILTRDTAFQVRYEMLMSISRAAAASKDCSAMLSALDDPAPTVVLRAIDLLPAGCREQDSIVEKLDALATNLRYPSAASWHVPSRAIGALARLDRKLAPPHLANAAAHSTWHVRAAAAAGFGTIGDAAALEKLARDSNPNVQNAALEALRRLNASYATLMPASLACLTSSDHQLLRTASTVMPAPVDADRDDATNALLGALRRLTAMRSDTSRDARVALIQRLPTVLPRERAAELAEYATDFDPKVRAAAQTAYTKLTGNTLPVNTKLSHHYPLQPRDLNLLPTTARIQMMDGSTIELEMLINDAPVTVARFAALARVGYYNGLTFHRNAPNFVVQGGSPGANEYQGVSRYMRDEIGAHHLRGAVGISTRGRDTGDAQIFIDLVDVPRLDHEYTVFARVVTGMQHVDRMLEGAAIRAITVK